MRGREACNGGDAAIPRHVSSLSFTSTCLAEQKVEVGGREAGIPPHMNSRMGGSELHGKSREKYRGRQKKRIDCYLAERWR